jgi:hypothetical protein
MVLEIITTTKEACALLEIPLVDRSDIVAQVEATKPQKKMDFTFNGKSMRFMSVRVLAGNGVVDRVWVIFSEPVEVVSTTTTCVCDTKLMSWQGCQCGAMKLEREKKKKA